MDGGMSPLAIDPSGGEDTSSYQRSKGWDELSVH